MAWKSSNKDSPVAQAAATCLIHVNKQMCALTTTMKEIKMTYPETFVIGTWVPFQLSLTPQQVKQSFLVSPI
jgi:hypothetical protein